MTRPDGIVDFEPSSRYFPFESRWFDSSVGPLHYIDEGEGRPLLLLHGNPDWSFLYRKMVPGLEHRFRCVVPDYPGFGLSIHPPAPYGYMPREHADVGSPPMQALIKRRNFFVTTVMKRLLQAKLSDEEFAHYTAVVPTPASRQGIAEFPRQIRASGPRLAELEQRVQATLTDRLIVLVQGKKDPAFGSDRTLERWRSTFPDHRVVVLPEAGHDVQEDAPESIVRAIIERFAA